MRTAVASLCVKRTPIRGRYRLHVHMSSPDAMRELLVTVDDDRLGHVRVLAIPYDLEAA